MNHYSNYYSGLGFLYGGYSHGCGYGIFLTLGYGCGCRSYKHSPLCGSFRHGCHYCSLCCGGYGFPSLY
uniref:Uncharacterized protein n=2 Tax=Sus scrofa TaxID=9823 RepID=A0A8W4FF52_PIG